MVFKKPEKPNSVLGGVRPTLKSPYLAVTLNLHPYTQYIDAETKSQTDYERLDPDEQRAKLVKLLDETLTQLDISLSVTEAEQLRDNNFIFEFCKDGRVHCHGYIGFPINRVSQYWCSKVSTLFYNMLQRHVETPRNDPNTKHAFIKVKIIEDIDVWKTYMMKDQVDNPLKCYKYKVAYKNHLKDLCKDFYTL